MSGKSLNCPNRQLFEFLNFANVPTIMLHLLGLRFIKRQADSRRLVGSPHLCSGWWSPCAWHSAVAILVLTLVFAVFDAQGAKTKKILVLYSFSDLNIYSSPEALESAIRSQVPWPVDFDLSKVGRLYRDLRRIEMTFAFVASSKGDR